MYHNTVTTLIHFHFHYHTITTHSNDCDSDSESESVLIWLRYCDIFIYTDYNWVLSKLLINTFQARHPSCVGYN
jgi:hypothetical protein